MSDEQAKADRAAAEAWAKEHNIFTDKDDRDICAAGIRAGFLAGIAHEREATKGLVEKLRVAVEALKNIADLDYKPLDGRDDDKIAREALAKIGVSGE